MTVCLKNVCVEVHKDEVCIRFAWDSAERNALCFRCDPQDRDSLLRARKTVVEIAKLMRILKTYIDCLSSNYSCICCIYLKNLGLVDK